MPVPVLRNITELKRNPHNVKLHSKEQLNDIFELTKMAGFIYPVVIDEHDMIFAGHGRIDMLEEFTENTEVPCVNLKDLSEDAKKVFMLMDNKVNESPWIKEEVQLVFNSVPTMEFDKFNLKFEESFKMNFNPDEQVTTIDNELETHEECPKCGYKW